MTRPSIRTAAAGVKGTISEALCRIRGPLATPTETPQVRDTAADPHRNPTDETAHSGTLVMRVKRTKDSRSAAWMRVSWAIGVFSR